MIRRTALGAAVLVTLLLTSCHVGMAASPTRTYVMPHLSVTVPGSWLSKGTQLGTFMDLGDLYITQIIFAVTNPTHTTKIGVAISDKTMSAVQLTDYVKLIVEAGPLITSSFSERRVVINNRPFMLDADKQDPVAGSFNYHALYSTIWQKHGILIVVAAAAPSAGDFADLRTIINSIQLH